MRTAKVELLFIRKKKCTGVKSILVETFKALQLTQSNDIIICWYDFMGVVLWWLSKLTFSKRKIVIVNILLKEKQTLKNKIARFLYRFTLKSNSVRSTVTSVEYGKWLNRYLKIDKEHTLLKDIYYGDEYYLKSSSNTDVSNENNKLTVDNNSVFCGGKNGRDWNFLFEIAKKLPKVTFNCVMSQKDFDKFVDSLVKLKNIKVYVNTSLEEFCNILQSSKMVVMPLDTEAPAGLIVMFEAAFYEKLVLTSNNMVTRSYLSDNRGVILDKNVDDWVKAVQECLSDNKKSIVAARNFKSYLNESCNLEIFFNTLKNIVEPW